MKILIVVGARPNFMKAAPLLFAIREHNAGTRLAGQIQCILVHTGQHYDEAMSGSFFSDLSLPEPDIQLGVGSGSHAVQTAEVMRRFEVILLEHQPDLVIVVGDVNSTLACALVASKISLETSGNRPMIAHVEAGLRSFDRAMPEEINRVMTDHLSDLLFVTEQSGIENLEREGIPGERIHFVGNTMIDSLLASRAKAEESTVLETLGLRPYEANSNASVARYALLTLHRPSNVDNRATLLSILDGLKDLAGSCPILFAAHPRTRKRIVEFGLEHVFNFRRHRESGSLYPLAPGIHLLEPLGYLDFLSLTQHASIVVTDSGGIQEETTCLGIPCVTVRENTERPVTVSHGTNVIAGTNSDDIRRLVRNQITAPKRGLSPEKWDGKAAERIVQVLVKEFQNRKTLGSAVSVSAVTAALPATSTT